MIKGAFTGLWVLGLVFLLIPAFLVSLDLCFHTHSIKDFIEKAAITNFLGLWIYFACRGGKEK